MARTKIFSIIFMLAAPLLIGICAILSPSWFVATGPMLFAQDGDSDPVAELSQLENDLQADPSAGGSIRDNSGSDNGAMERKTDERNLTGTVLKVRLGQNPFVFAVRVKVTALPKKSLFSGIKKGDVFWIVPVMKTRNNQFDFSDPMTLVNAGGYYLHNSDQILFRIENKAGDLIRAAYIERK